MFIKVGQDGGAYTAYMGDTISLSDSLQHFSLSFSMTHPTGPAARVEFNGGKSRPSFRIANVALVEGASEENDSQAVDIVK